MASYVLKIENVVSDCRAHNAPVEACLTWTAVDDEGYQIGKSALPLSELKRALRDLKASDEILKT